MIVLISKYMARNKLPIGAKNANVGIAYHFEIVWPVPSIVSMTRLYLKSKQIASMTVKQENNSPVSIQTRDEKQN